MQHQAYINASVDIRIPTEVESVNYNQIDKEKENLADYLFNNPGELLKYNVINIKVLDLEVGMMARRKVIRVRIKGKLMTLREVSEKYHISPELLRYRYKHKMRGDELLCGRKDSKSKEEVEYMKSQIKDEEKGREKIRKKAILNRYQRNVRAEYEQERKRRLRPWLL
ncbi:putative phi PVL-like protein [Staphylococcus aureus]|uniref:Putative phi PVL-like protein n=9 Tax=Staphylococcus aureus TaxID=1280 RepID=A0A380DU89_STAAU|nr:putative phi PVL-like protein [Staphylococcus aureus]